MTIYHGIVRANRVELEGNARLSDGARVEVRPVDLAAPRDMDTMAAEEVLLRDLIAEGVLEEPPADEFGPDEPFAPVTVQGELLSEQIIRERR